MPLAYVLKRRTFKFIKFSDKQKQVLTWWVKPQYNEQGLKIKNGSPHCDKDAIITDGAVRSGKTIIMSLSFILWATSEFNGSNFGMAGKTIGSFKRNVWFWLKLILIGRGFKVKKLPDLDNSNAYAISKGNKENYFYIFGGKDERSQDLVQGFTAAGFLFDEVTLMPESFANQCVARCSESGAKLWFNCNPQGPFHWFKLTWIDNIVEKNALRLQFTLDDNPSLSEDVKTRYRRSFAGVFFKRFILGLWVIAEGVIYPELPDTIWQIDVPPRVSIEAPEGISRYFVACDYGITNPHVYLLCGISSIKGEPHIYILDEYYNENSMLNTKTDDLFLKDYLKFIGNKIIQNVVIDPSAASLINLFRQNGIGVRAADNSVMSGIQNVSSWIRCKRLHVVRDRCPNLLKEFNSYVWDDKAQQLGKDEPLKQSDHALDALRYLINTIYPIKGTTGPVNVRGV